MEAPEAMRERLILALEMVEAGVAMVEARLRREHPGATEEDIARLLAHWLNERPPDAPGHVRRFDEGEAR